MTPKTIYVACPRCRTIDAATDAWRASEDVIYRFAEDRLTFDPNSWTTLAAMYDEYGSWCAAEGRPSGSQKEFGKRFEDHDTVAGSHVTKRRTKHGWRWEGVAIREPGDTGDIDLVGSREQRATKTNRGYVTSVTAPELQASRAITR